MPLIRVLHVIGGMGCGGAEAMVMNLYRAMDREKVQFDFAVHKTQRQMYDGEIEALGGRIYRFPKFKGGNFGEYIRAWNAHFDAHPEHQIVHGHIGSSAAVYLSVAKRRGRVAIAHSHSTKTSIRDMHARLWELYSYPTRYIADRFFACSPEAAVDRYGKKVAGGGRCVILHNGIDCERFAFDPKSREEVRKELGLDGKMVVGHVGRHTPPKNPLFLLEIFAEVHRLEPAARLLQVGQGELTEQMQERCKALGIQDAVIFAGAHSDVERYYSAMDVFLFPSLWEGLGMVAVEAQTNGLPTVISDAVPPLADIGAGTYHVMGLDQPADAWAEEVLKHKSAPRAADAVRYAIKRGYDVRESARELSEFYLTELKKNGMCS